MATKRKLTPLERQMLLALRPFAYRGHLSWCPWTGVYAASGKCTCGVTEAKAAIAAAQKLEKP